MSTLTQRSNKSNSDIKSDEPADATPKSKSSNKSNKSQQPDAPSTTQPDSPASPQLVYLADLLTQLCTWLTEDPTNFIWLALGAIQGEGNEKPKFPNVIAVHMTFFLFGSLSFFLVLLDVSYAIGGVVMIVGILVTSFPKELADYLLSFVGIQSKTAEEWSLNKIQKWLGWAICFIGVLLLRRAKAKADGNAIALLVLVAIILTPLLVEQIWKEKPFINYKVIGIFALLVQFVAWFQVVPNTTRAFALALYCFGWLYQSMPYDLITWTAIDNYILGYGACAFGAILLVLSFVV